MLPERKCDTRTRAHTACLETTSRRSFAIPRFYQDCTWPTLQDDDGWSEDEVDSLQTPNCAPNDVGRGTWRAASCSHVLAYQSASRFPWGKHRILAAFFSKRPQSPFNAACRLTPSTLAHPPLNLLQVYVPRCSIFIGCPYPHDPCILRVRAGLTRPLLAAFEAVQFFVAILVEGSKSGVFSPHISHVDSMFCLTWCELMLVIDNLVCLPLNVLLRTRRVPMADGDEKLTSATTTSNFHLVKSIDKNSFGKVMLVKKDNEGVRQEAT